MVAKNVFGQNTAAIAALEAQYGEMWAQDAAAMYGYAGSSATASKVTPFAAPHQTTNPAGQAVQAAAVTHAVGASAGASQATLSQLVAGLPNALHGLASPASSVWQTPGVQQVLQLLTGASSPPQSLSSALTDYGPLASFFYNTEGLPYFSVGMLNNFIQTARTMGAFGGAAAPAAAAAGAAAAPGLPSLGGLVGGAPVAAGLGQAGAVGGLSVPSAWTGAVPGLGQMGATPMPISAVSATPDVGGPGNLLGGLPLAGAHHAGMAGSAPRYGFRPTVMARPPFAG